MEEGIFGAGDSEAEISRLERPAKRQDWVTPDGTLFDLTIPATVYPPREDTNVLARALRTLGPGKGQRLLEIGCGSGAVSIYAASLGYRVRACDINPYAVAATKANAKRLGLDVEVFEGGPGPKEDGLVEQWAGQELHDIVVWNLPYLTHDASIDDVLGPLEEAALLDTDQKGLTSRLMKHVSDNQLINDQGLMLLLVSGNSRGLEAERVAQKHGFAARCVTTHSFKEGDPLRVVAIWQPYNGASRHHFSEIPSTNQAALDQSQCVGDLFTAQHQTKARGRRNRTWSSEDKCFAGTWTLALGTPSMSPGLIQILAGHAVITTHAILGAKGDAMVLKWPNDIIQLADGSTGKVAGVLVEGVSKGEESKIVLGIGVNFSTNQPRNHEFPIAYLDEVIPGVDSEQYTAVIHAVIASYFEHRDGVKNTPYQALIGMLNKEVKRSEQVLGNPNYRMESWVIKELDNEGNLTLINSQNKTVNISDGEDLGWPLISKD